MRQFVNHQILHLRIFAASVLWILTRYLQPSNGALQNGWGSFYDHYGENLQHLAINAGDVLMKENGVLVLIYSARYYFQMQTVDLTEDDYQVQCFFYNYPKQGENWPRALKKQPAPYDWELALTLAAKFVNRFFPFHHEYCNKSHYMNYILYGTLVQSAEFQECPLSASLIRVKAIHVLKGIFKLRDSAGQEHDFREYNFPRQAKPEASIRARTSSSSNRMKRTISWEQRQNTFRRVVTNPFQSFSRKRSRSV